MGKYCFIIIIIIIYVQACQAVIHSYVSCFHNFLNTVMAPAHTQNGHSGNVSQTVLWMWQNLIVAPVKHTVKGEHELHQKVDVILKVKQDESVSTWHILFLVCDILYTYMLPYILQVYITR